MSEKLEHILDVQERINTSLGLKLPYNNIFSIFEFFYKFFGVAELKEEIEELKAENDALKAELQEANQRIQFLEGELKECHCELEKCRHHDCDHDHCEHKCDHECEHKCDKDCEQKCFETKCGKIIINIALPRKHRKHRK